MQKKKEKKPEQVRILIGGVAYHSQVVPTTGAAEGVETIELLEDAGKGVPAGTTLLARYDGTRHPVARERQFHPLDEDQPRLIIAPDDFTEAELYGSAGYRQLWAAWTAATDWERDTFRAELRAHHDPRPPIET